jgi:drug/metabolite transporter (DMT)-like permease
VRQHPGSFVAGILFVVIGVAFLGESFGWWDVAVGRLWPIALIAAGVVTMLNAARHRDDSA